MAAQKPRHKPLKYWQKLYGAVLALFLACLLGGLFVVAQISCQLSFDARRDEFLARQAAAAQALAEDLTALLETRPDAIPALCQATVRKAEPQGLAVAAGQGEQTLAAALPGANPLPLPAPGQRSWQVAEVEGERYLYATTAYGGALAGYWCTAAAPVGDFYRQWQRTTGLLVGLALAVTAAFAVGLYAVLYRMNRPLGALSATAAALAGGDYAAHTAPPVAARTDELGDLGRTLDALARRVRGQIEALNAEARAKQALVDDLSHEMRTPLTAIDGYAQTIRLADLQGEELWNATETISFESRRLLSLAQQLVALSAVNHLGEGATMAQAPGQTDTPPAAPALQNAQPVPLAGLLQRVQQAAAPFAQGRGVALVLGELPADAVVRGQPDLLESLFVNLCDNAAKASPPGSTVTLAAEPAESTAPAAPNTPAAPADPKPAPAWCVTVTDAGCGMTAETLAQLGRPFFRADKARARAQGGAGLGVALCYAIAAAHGAKLTYQSQVGVGTTARVTLKGQ